MSYLAFKEKMNGFRNDEFQRRKVFDQMQVFFVGAFWVLFTSALLYYDYGRKNNERTSLKIPATPDLEFISKFPTQVSAPGVGALDKQ